MNAVAEGNLRSIVGGTGVPPVSHARDVRAPTGMNHYRIAVN